MGNTLTVSCNKTDAAINTEAVLRSLGLTGKLTGFHYTIYMVDKVAEDPGRLRLITKCLYCDTAKCFRTTPSCVERACRTLIQSVWIRGNRTTLNGLAGYSLTQRPTNSEFIDMLAAYIRKK